MATKKVKSPAVTAVNTDAFFDSFFQPDIPVEVVISFDTTGSMATCIEQVRRGVRTLVRRMFDEMPNLRLGIIAHGDYGDTKPVEGLDLTADAARLEKFVKEVPNTFGDDFEECYELAFRVARRFNWSPAAQKVFIVIGDAAPHAVNSPRNRYKLDWRAEVQGLADAGVRIFAVQALNHPDGTKFFDELGNSPRGMKLNLAEFNDTPELLTAMILGQQGTARLVKYEQELQTSGRLTRGLRANFDSLLKRESKTSRSVHAIPDGRFYELQVDRTGDIASFVERKGHTFAPGRGFYEFTKTETIQPHKEVIIQEKATGDFYGGSRARTMAGIPVKKTARVSPDSLPGYRFFVQSTSSNRKLLAGTRFLYEQ